MKYGEEAVYALLDLLNEAGVPYMVVGSLSSNAYGEPRASKDADFVVDLDPEARQRIVARLPDGFLIRSTRIAKNKAMTPDDLRITGGGA